VKQKKNVGRKQFFATIILLVIMLFTGTCTTPRSRPVGSVQEMPNSQGSTEIRTAKPYILDVGDELSVKVWGFDEFSKSCVVDNTGEVNYPLLGRLKVAGKTLPQAQEMLKTGLKKYLVDPQVEVASSGGRNQVFVVGEVSNSGAVSFTRPLKVTEAIAKAGWVNQYANKSNILLVRRSADRFNVYKINIGETFQDGSVEPQLFLQPGDIVYVPPRKITTISRFMFEIGQAIQPFLTAEQMVVLWPSLRSAFSGGTTGLSISTTTSAPAQ
jgi:protein involved in polysaccharide export with SLBB domain